MKHTDELIRLLEDNEYSRYEDFPDIELYMDQLLKYLSRETVSLRKEDKLTSAMVNNYIREGLLPRAKGKRYSAEHLSYLMIIARLKQVLSVKDIRALINKEEQKDNVKTFYDDYMNSLNNQTNKLINNIKQMGQAPLGKMALELAIRSYINKIACEYLIDMMNEEI